MPDDDDSYDPMDSGVEYARAFSRWQEFLDGYGLVEVDDASAVQG